MKPSERLQSLDALRGFDMLFIMGFASLVVAVCGLWPNAVTDSIASQMGHASWDGFTHHDTIFPLFLFIAGVSFPFSLSKQRSLGLSTGTIYAKIVRRALTLVLLGVIYNGLFRLDFENLRIASVLGRIGLAWGIAAVLYLNFGVKARIAIAAAILVGYGLLSALVAAPDVAGAGPLTREGCLAGYVDRLLLPGKLYGKTFDPEGLLSTVPAVVTAMLGMFTGEFVRRQDLSGGRKASWMIAAAVALLVAGLAFNVVRADALFHPDHGVPSAEFIPAARKLPDEPIAEMRMKLRAVSRQVCVVRPVRAADAGIEILNVLRAQHRLERGVQPLARPPVPLILAQVNAHLHRPVIGGAAAERPGVGIADDLVAALRDQVRIAAERGAHTRGKFLDIRHGALERNGRLFHIRRVNFQQRGRVPQARGADAQRSDGRDCSVKARSRRGSPYS